ncbi:MAG: hypothetical protein U0931_25315 [Vulcanimicrobiota bacterium]
MFKKKKRPTLDYDELPQREEGYNFQTPALLIFLVAALFFWWRLPAKPTQMQARDLSIQGVHLGDSYRSLSKPSREIRSPKGERFLTYASGASYYLKSDQVVSMAVTGRGAVQFRQATINVGDSRDSIEKLLGVVDPARVLHVTQITWPGPDCRLSVVFDPADWKARTLKVYSP